jgi:hypothetical protein
MREITLLRLRALLARANGDDTVYLDYRDHYRDGHRAGLRGAYEVGRGDAVTAGPMSSPGVPKWTFIFETPPSWAPPTNVPD